MAKKDISEENYIPEKDEIREESNGQIRVKEGRNFGENNEGLMNEVVDKANHNKDFISLNEKNEGFNFPETEVETGQWTSFKADVAQQVGRFSDQVVIGSPAAETDDLTIGRSGLKDIINAADEQLAKKMKDK
ncbi:hypothetical protein [Orenia marismortui]|uniref:Uncharacterized protein n=1 Tax=Orenia marismortui TaxID=46469 RepID=A0A4V6QBA2_9FIRM|nr:hypothetical protein [Orenia marismortui]TDX52881.1 hypothetical protein C7959_1046 [Orenia marismortui]